MVLNKQISSYLILLISYFGYADVTAWRPGDNSVQFIKKLALITATIIIKLITENCIH